MKRQLILCLTVFLLLTSSLTTHASDLTIIAEDAPPNSFYLDNQKTGKAYEIVRAILIQLEMQDTDIKILPWARGYKLLTNQDNVALFPTSRTLSREDLFHWVGPIYKNDISLYRLKYRNDIHPQTLDQLKPYTIGVGRNDIKDQFLTGKGLKTYQVSQDTQNISKLMGGRVDLIAYADTRFEYDVGNLNFDRQQFVKLMNLKEISTPAYIAFNKSIDVEIVEQFQQALNEIIKNKTHARILNKWDH